MYVETCEEYQVREDPKMKSRYAYARLAACPLVNTMFQVCIGWLCPQVCDWTITNTSTLADHAEPCSAPVTCRHRTAEKQTWNFPPSLSPLPTHVHAQVAMKPRPHGWQSSLCPAPTIPSATTY